MRDEFKPDSVGGVGMHAIELVDLSLRAEILTGREYMPLFKTN